MGDVVSVDELHGVLGEVSPDLVPEVSVPSANSRRRRRGLKEIIAEVTACQSATVIEVELMPDHVDLLIEIAPTVPRWRFGGAVTGRSSRLLRCEYRRLRRLPSLWTRSWLMSTVAGTLLKVDRRNVDNQRLVALMSHRYRLNRDAGHALVLEGHCRDARLVRNLAMEQMNLWTPGRRRVDTERGIASLLRRL